MELFVCFFFNIYLLFGCVGLSCNTQDLHYVTQDLSLQDRFHCPEECGILVPWPGIKLTSPELQGRLLPARPPGNSLWNRFVGFFGFVFFLPGNSWPDACQNQYVPQFSSVAQSCPTLCHPMNSSTPGLPVHHHLPEFTQTHVHRVSDAIQPSHPVSSPSPPAPNPSQQTGSPWSLP